MYFNTSWLQSLTWLPYIGHNIMFYLFKRFASLSALPHSSFKFGNQKNNLLSPWILEHLIDEAFFKNFHQLHIQIKLGK